jgi:hypothetical protein
LKLKNKHSHYILIIKEKLFLNPSSLSGMLSVEFSLFNIKQQARRNSPLIAGAALPSKMSQTSFSIREGAISNSYFLEEERLFHTYLITGRVSHHQGPISKVQAKSPVHCQQSGEKDLPQLGILNYWAFVTLQEVATVVDLKTLFVLKCTNN